MTAATLTLTEFLGARLSEDERLAMFYLHPDCFDDLTDRTVQAVRAYAAHTLAEVAATRAVAELHSTPRGFGDGIVCAICFDVRWDHAPASAWPCATLRAVTQVWASHGDWREEWSA